MKFKRNQARTTVQVGEEMVQRSHAIDPYTELLGPAGTPLASVSITTEVRVSVDFGNRAGCWATVTLQCEQETEKLKRAGVLAMELASKLADEGQEQAAITLNNARGLEDDSEQAEVPKSGWKR